MELGRGECSVEVGRNSGRRLEDRNTDTWRNGHVPWEQKNETMKKILWGPPLHDPILKCLPFWYSGIACAIYAVLLCGETCMAEVWSSQPCMSLSSCSLRVSPHGFFMWFLQWGGLREVRVFTDQLRTFSVNAILLILSPSRILNFTSATSFAQVFLQDQHGSETEDSGSQQEKQRWICRHWIYQCSPLSLQDKLWCRFQKVIGMKKGSSTLPIVAQWLDSDLLPSGDSSIPVRAHATLIPN